MVGVNENADINQSNVVSCCGNQDGLAADAARAISITISANTPNMAMAAAAWQ
jgi:hypothetical protein